MKYSKRTQCGHRFQNKHTITTLDKALWRVFTQFIKLRDSKGGFASCISCQKWCPVSEMDCGHFISRNKKATKYNEQNVNLQCRKCNRFLSGRQFEHGLNIDRKYGKGTAEKILALSQQRCKLSSIWYEEMIKEYKEKIRRLK